MANLHDDFDYKKDQAGYKYMIGLLPHHFTEDSVVLLIKEFQDEPYFNIEDFIDPSYKWMRYWGRQPPSTLEYKERIWVSNGIHHDIIAYLINYGIALILLLHGRVFTIEDYLAIEQLKNYLTEELMTKAKRKMIFQILEQFKVLEKADRMPEETEQEKDLKSKEKHRARGQVMGTLNMLGERSSEFPRAFIDGLAKKFGLDFYLDWSEQKRFGLVPKKDGKLDVHDVAKQVNTVMLNKELLLTLFNKGDEQAKEYLRGLVYVSQEAAYETTKSGFILDNANEPMDINMKEIEWPLSFRSFRPLVQVKVYTQHIKNFPSYSPEYNEKMKDYWTKWVQIISEFGNIPQ
jgi:hypothetical protein